MDAQAFITRARAMPVGQIVLNKIYVNDHSYKGGKIIYQGTRLYLMSIIIAVIKLNLCHGLSKISRASND